ncbi:mitochondrial putative cruciform cutting endonuclease 1 [Stipitochalara longipes BDJ]|nr:mitochondrial putative cruciform cutting endonuclease 1 [Stipitochalara longipes BDJ]
MALTLPTNLKLAQLKQLAFKCGLLTSGTKPILIARLHDEITLTPRQRPALLRVLSIDMGIRNLAYCILDVPKASSKKPPSIRAWHRLAVSTTPEVLDVEPDERLKVAPVKEVFNPATLSAAAYKLLRKKLLLEEPTHILIERQRFRSMGSPTILEWTVRVNMFESILYAVLCTLKGEGVWNGEVHAIAPGKVGPFWVGEETAGVGRTKMRKSLSAKIRNKGAKIDLVRGWLEGAEMMVLGNEDVETVATRYKKKWDRSPGGRRKDVEDGEEKMGKLDDLADCLLQGMAWIQWEENKRMALKHGVQVLLETTATSATSKTSSRPKKPTRPRPAEKKGKAGRKRATSL